MTDQEKIDRMITALRVISQRDGCGADHITCHDCYDSSTEAMKILAEVEAPAQTYHLSAESVESKVK